MNPVVNVPGVVIPVSALAGQIDHHTRILRPLGRVYAEQVRRGGAVRAVAGPAAVSAELESRLWSLRETMRGIAHLRRMKVDILRRRVRRMPCSGVAS